MNDALRLLLHLFAGWVNRRQLDVIGSHAGENPHHWDALAAADLFTVEVLTLGGLVRYYYREAA